MMSNMRAKLRVTFVNEQFYGSDKEKSGETLSFCAVCANKYPESGDDENNTFAKFSPSADLNIQVANPNLWDKFKVGQEYYVDFTLAE